jgi:transcriptional regulator with XRE-family HTH domain
MDTTGIDGRAVAERLRSLMAERGWTKKELSEEAGVPQTAISYWLRGHAPKLSSASLLCERLGINLHWLLVGDGERDVRDDPEKSIDGLGFASRLRVVLRELGITQDTAARQIHMGQSGISYYLSGNAPKIPMLRYMADSFGVRFEWLAYSNGPMWRTSEASHDGTSTTSDNAVVPNDPAESHESECEKTERTIESIFGPRPAGDRRHRTPRSDFGRRLMEACRARGIDSQATLARRLGFTQRTVRRWISLNRASSASIGVICFLLRLNRRWLVEGIGHMDALPEPEPVQIGIAANELCRIRGERVPLLRPPPRSSATVLNMRRVHPEQLKYRPAPVGVAA